eukprot:s306_g28.t2
MGRLQGKDPLAEALREAKELQEELELEEADVAQLRIQADLALKQKQQWEAQLEVSRSCIQKLEAKLSRTRKAKAEGKFGNSEDLRSPGRQVPRYRSAMMECSPRSQKSGKSGKGSPEKKQTRRQRTAMLLADGTPKATANAARIEHSRTDAEPRIMFCDLLWMSEVPLHMQGIYQADKRMLKELEELVKQRDRLEREREALRQQAEEHDREVQSFVHVLRALPQAKVMPEVLKQEVLEAEQEIKAYHRSLPSVGHVDTEKHKVVEEELLQCQRWGEETAEQQEVCEEQARRLQEEMTEMQREALAAKQEESAVREEAAARKLQCAECSMAYRRQQVTKANLTRQVRDLQVALARVRGEVSAEQAAEQKSVNAELEAKCRSLRQEVEEHAALRSKATQQRHESEVETVQLEESTARIALQLHADEEAQAQLQATLTSSQRFAERQLAELRAQELVGEALTEEVMKGRQMEEALRSELRQERQEAQEASSVALALLSMRRLKAEEAREALLQCNDALAASDKAQEELAQRQDQLEHSARSSQKMHEMLMQRLSTVHDKVKNAESAHAQALKELQAERREQSRLSQQLVTESSTKFPRSRVVQGLLQNWNSSGEKWLRTGDAHLVMVRPGSVPMAPLIRLLMLLAGADGSKQERTTFLMAFVPRFLKEIGATMDFAPESAVLPCWFGPGVAQGAGELKSSPFASEWKGSAEFQANITRFNDLLSGPYDPLLAMRAGLGSLAQSLVAVLEGLQECHPDVVPSPGIALALQLQRLVAEGRLNDGFCPFTGKRQITIGGAEVSDEMVQLQQRSTKAKRLARLVGQMLVKVQREGDGPDPAGAAPVNWEMLLNTTVKSWSELIRGMPCLEVTWNCEKVQTPSPASAFGTRSQCRMQRPVNQGPHGMFERGLVSGVNPISQLRIQPGQGPRGLDRKKPSSQRFDQSIPWKKTENIHYALLCIIMLYYIMIWNWWWSI